MEHRDFSSGTVLGECGEHASDRLENMVTVDFGSVVRVSQGRRLPNSMSAKAHTAGGTDARRLDLVSGTKTRLGRSDPVDVMAYFDTAEAVFLGLDSSGIIRFVNYRGALLLDRNEEDLLGSNWLDICIRNRDRACAQKHFAHLMRNRAEPPMVFAKTMHRGGKESLVEWRLTVLRGAQQRVTGAAFSVSIRKGLES